MLMKKFVKDTLKFLLKEKDIEDQGPNLVTVEEPLTSPVPLAVKHVVDEEDPLQQEVEITEVY
jgi:hypothetical protein